ncbi:SMI1/KNR4 family protein [Streptomyces sp. NPDC002018]|uniref:SMI1/KNR4 family protein n=1 Tax=Streptomyces sp. NPDC002018 TaxID=3364629 RepID=UPI0036833F7E
MELSQFRDLLGPPQCNREVEGDWGATGRDAGIDFPGDYKEFISAYGPGCINEQLYLYHPKGEAGGAGLRLAELWDQAALAHAALSQDNPEEFQYPLHPAVGGLVAVGRSISGNALFLVPPRTERGSWGVAVDMGEWAFFDLSFTDFLWKALQGDLFLPVVEGEPSFEPTGRLDPPTV